MKPPKKYPCKYEKGIRYITRKDTTKEAVKPFEFLLSSEIRGIEVGKFGRFDEAFVQEKVRETIEAYRAIGFSKDLLEGLRYAYTQLKRRAPRKKKVKKEFDAKGLPKMPNTPENRAIMREFIEIRKRNLSEK